MGQIVDLIIFKPPETSYSWKSNKINATWHAIPRNRIIDKKITKDFLYGYFIDRKSPITILYSHANAEDIGLIFKNLNYKSKLWSVNIFAYEYTGYGNHKQYRPNEESLCEDVNCAYKYLNKELKIKNKNMIVMGRSLGSVPTSDIASKHHFRAVILQSPLHSIKKFVSLPLVISNQYDNSSRVQKISCKTFFIHGGDDKIIPPSHSLDLFKISKFGTYEIIKSANHNNLELYGSCKLIEKFINDSCFDMKLPKSIYLTKSKTIQVNNYEIINTPKVQAISYSKLSSCPSLSYEIRESISKSNLESLPSLISSYSNQSLLTTSKNIKNESNFLNQLVNSNESQTDSTLKDAKIDPYNMASINYSNTFESIQNLKSFSSSVSTTFSISQSFTSSIQDLNNDYEHSIHSQNLLNNTSKFDSKISSEDVFHNKISNSSLYNINSINNIPLNKENFSINSQDSDLTFEKSSNYNKDILSSKFQDLDLEFKKINHNNKYHFDSTIKSKILLQKSEYETSALKENSQFNSQNTNVSEYSDYEKIVSTNGNSEYFTNLKSFVESYSLRKDNSPLKTDLNNLIFETYSNENNKNDSKISECQINNNKTEDPSFSIGIYNSDSLNLSTSFSNYETSSLQTEFSDAIENPATISFNKLNLEENSYFSTFEPFILEK